MAPPHGRREKRPHFVLASTMRRRFRELISPSATPPQRPPSAPPLPAVEHKKKGSVTSHPQVESKRVLGTSSNATALSTASPSSDTTDLVPDKPGSTKESAWRAAYGAARIAVDIAKDSSDMFLPLKAVVSAISVLVKNYDVRRSRASRALSTNQLLLPANGHKCWTNGGDRGKGTVSW